MAKVELGKPCPFPFGVWCELAPEGICDKNCPVLLKVAQEKAKKESRMNREILINEARRVMAAQAELRFAEERQAAAEKQTGEALDALRLCEKKLAEAIGMPCLNVLLIAEALLLVAEPGGEKEGQDGT